jgi:hypothetical protein
VDENGSKKSLSPLERKTPGVIPDWLERIAVMCWPQASSVVVRRGVYEKIGGFCEELPHTNDWDMWKRIAVNYPVWFEPQPLASYRYLHPSSHTYSLIRTGANVREYRRSIAISRMYLPKTVAEKLSRSAEEYYGAYALKTGCRMLLKGDMTAAFAQTKEAVNCAHSLTEITRIFLRFVCDAAYYPLKLLCNR